MVSMRSRVVFNRFPELAVGMAAAVDAAVRETATKIEQDVKGGPHAAPYRTGNLRRSYHMSHKQPGVAEVGNDTSVAHYALFVEYGTVNMSAQPHLRPAAEAQREPFKERIKAILGGKL